MAKKDVFSELNPNLVLLIGGGFASYFFIVKPVLQAINLMDDKDDVAVKNENNEANNQLCWQPYWYKQYLGTRPTKLILTDYGATSLAKQLHAAWGLFTDDEDAVYAVFRSLRSKMFLSQLAEKYQQLYGKDLLQSLVAPWYTWRGLNDREFNVVANIVNKLPDYVLA